MNRALPVARMEIPMIKIVDIATKALEKRSCAVVWWYVCVLVFFCVCVNYNVVCWLFICTWKISRNAVLCVVWCSRFFDSIWFLLTFSSEFSSASACMGFDDPNCRSDFAWRSPDDPLCRPDFAIGIPDDPCRRSDLGIARWNLQKFAQISK